MLQAAHDYVKNNRTGQTEIWICSDLRANDWNAENGRWKSLARQFPEVQAERAVSSAGVSGRRRRQRGGARDRHRTSRRPATVRRYSCRCSCRATGGEGKLSVPLQFEVEGARSELTVEMEGRELELKNHRIPLSKATTRKVGAAFRFRPTKIRPTTSSISSSTNRRRDTRSSSPKNRKQARPLELAAGSSPDPAIKSDVEGAHAGPIVGRRLGRSGPAALAGAAAEWRYGQRDSAVCRAAVGKWFSFRRARRATEKCLDVHWTNWETPPEPIRVETWRGDQDLLVANAKRRRPARRRADGAALLRPEGRVHARSRSSTAAHRLLARVTTDHGGVYFCSTTTSTADSSLGVERRRTVRRNSTGAGGGRGRTRQRPAACGRRRVSHEPAGNWQQLAGSENTLSTEYPFQAGVYAAGKRHAGRQSRRSRRPPGRSRRQRALPNCFTASISTASTIRPAT